MFGQCFVPECVQYQAIFSAGQCLVLDSVQCQRVLDSVQ